ncbi:restriction endonuclease subunit S [Listeria monocytogenes]|uniref:restriction endonuclease subunit S n=1 Tax=Listeria monocytogenes TaxID=1639 RepID=UPI00085BFB42|nr:restriction endonuclease subunit S [Listeria monocytogenes]EAD7632554.1 restriction endonuclease subunit S [Listeria monocytogenes]EAG9489082.1 restriction endonuclease subunit S [Listeria monocytogenes]EGU0986570.1 restriction endonuclease subunit S [Listeria monocytogenes]OET95651.1 type I restriction endonuclease subunit S [Listeria monocytogenes]WIH39481.1 restriction endonuclease subunit S [Listeria monocytogenes]
MLPLFYLISHYSNLPFRAWEQREVSDYAINTYGGGTPKTNVPEYWSGEIPWIQSSDLLISNLFNVIPKKYITELAVKSSATKFIPANSIAIVSRVGVGKLVFMPFEYTTSQDFLSLSNLQVDSNFGVYSIYMMLQKELKNIQGTSIKGITKTDLLEKNINKPLSKEEQQKIGGFFKQLDNTITLHQRKLDALKQMKKAFSQQIFPENNRKKPKIRFTSFYEEWEQRKIGEYGYFYYGKSAPKWSVAQDATTPCVRYGELYTKFGPKIDIVHSYTNIDKSNLKFSSGNEVLVPRVGENPLDFSNCSWLSISNVAIGEMISVYTTEQYPLFIAYYFRSKMKYEFAKRVEGGNVSNLYYSYLEDILISVPSIEEQKKIAEFLNKIDITINLLQNKLDRIKELKKAYLQNMFI